VAQAQLNWGFMTKSPKGSPELDEARLRQQAIGARLRQLFDDVVNEPVPDDFLEILRQAEPKGSAPPTAVGKSAAEGDDA
jgi:urease accessory protein UreF